MLIATFNVNSIKSRSEIVVNWLKETNIDVLAIQELKCVTENFPYSIFEDIGYHCLVSGQKAYNGVALISKEPFSLVEINFPYDEVQSVPDNQARWILAKNKHTYIASVYCPNGNPFPGPKFDYKLNWMQGLENRVKELLKLEIPTVIMGDFNLLPKETDCYDCFAMKDDALMQTEARSSYYRLCNMGLTDAWVANNGDKEGYTYWDYQRRRIESNQGLRIDHALLSPQLADRLKKCYVDRKPRYLNSPSDHTPLVIELE